jgi:hypothetical protein
MGGEGREYGGEGREYGGEGREYGGGNVASFRGTRFPLFLIRWLTKT